jgi:hypothetical protein
MASAILCGIRSEQHTGPVHLYRADADIEIVGDRLVCFPCNDSFENRTFRLGSARSCARRPCTDSSPVIRARPRGRCDRGEQRVFVSRLLN